MAEARSSGQDLGKLDLRVALGAVVLFHGVFKVTHGVEWIKGPLGELGLPGFLAYGTYAAEVLAPLLLFVGYKVRIAAAVIAFDMLMALVLVMRPQILTVKEAGGGWGVEIEALLLLVSVALVFMGGGRYGVERA